MVRVHLKQVVAVLAVGTLYFLLGGLPADTVQMNPAGVPNLPYLASRNLGPVGDGQISWHQVVWCKVQRQAALASGANHASNRVCRSPKKWQAFAGMIEYTPRWTDEGSGNSYRAWVGAAAIGEGSESALTGSVCTNAGITAAVQYRLTQRFGGMDQCPELDGEVGLEFSLVTTLDDKYPVGTTAWMIHRNLQRGWYVGCTPFVASVQDWQYIRGSVCSERGWSCLFRTHTHLVEVDQAIPQQCLQLADTVLAAVTQKRARLNHFPTIQDWMRRIDYRKQKLPLMGRWMLSAALFDLVTRVSPEVETWLDGHTIVVNPESVVCGSNVPIISMHIRQGDRCVNGMDRPGKACYALPDYADALAHLQTEYGACRVLLATDSKTIVEQLNSETSPLRLYTVTLVSLNRSLFFSSGECTPMPTCQFIENRAKTLGTDMSDVGMSLAADIQLLRHGDIFLGGFDTNVGRAIYFKMWGRLGQLPPFYHFQQGNKAMLVGKNPLASTQLLSDFDNEFPDWLGGPFTGVDNDE